MLILYTRLQVEADVPVLKQFVNEVAPISPPAPSSSLSPLAPASSSLPFAAPSPSCFSLLLLPSLQKISPLFLLPLTPKVVSILSPILLFLKVAPGWP